MFGTQDSSRQRSVVYCLDKSKLGHYNISNSFHVATSKQQGYAEHMELFKHDNLNLHLHNIHVVHMSCVKESGLKKTGQSSSVL